MSRPGGDGISGSARKLRRLLENQDRLISSVGHELRTPLAVVLGLSAELRDNAAELPREEIATLNGLVADQAVKMSAIIDNFLALARLDGPGLSTSRHSVDLAAVADQAVTDIRKEKSSVGITGSSFALGDPIRIRQIVRNLVDNALNYGGPNVQVWVGEVKGQAVVDVLDDGNGIPRSRQKEIFELFERSHQATGPGSMGLGLTVSRRLAQAMGGDVTYHRTGNRTCFRLTLPPVAEPPESRLRELVYQSTAAIPFTRADVESLLATSRRNNSESGITGLLIHHDGDFLQVLEGHPDAVQRIFDRIRDDPRHYRIGVVVDREISQRSFGDWAMGWGDVSGMGPDDGITTFMEGDELPPRASDYVRILFESFREHH